MFPAGSEDRRITLNPHLYASMMRVGRSDFLDITTEVPLLEGLRQGLMATLFETRVYVAKDAPDEACLLSWKQRAEHRVRFVCFKAERHDDWWATYSTKCDHPHCFIEEVMDS